MANLQGWDDRNAAQYVPTPDKRGGSRGTVRATGTDLEPSKGPDMDLAPCPPPGVSPSSVCGRPPAPGRRRPAGRLGPALGRTLRSHTPELSAPGQGRPRLLRGSRRKGRGRRHDPRPAHDPRGRDRARRERRRDRHARRHLPHGRPEAEPGDHAGSRTATSGRFSRGPAWRRSGRPCATTCGGPPGPPCSRPGRWAGGSATARACARRSTGSTTTWSSSTARC